MDKLLVGKYRYQVDKLPVGKFRYQVDKLYCREVKVPLPGG